MVTFERADLVLRASPLWCLLAALCGLFALLALVLVDLAVSLKLALALAIILTLVDAALDHGLRCRDSSVRRLVFLPGSGWQVRFADGRTEALEQTGAIVVSPWFVSLAFRRACGARLVVPIFADAAHPEAFRRFRVFLRLLREPE